MKGLAWLAVALLVAGCSEPAPPEPLPEAWRGRDLREPGWVNETIAPGWTLALQYQWSSGKRIEWDWLSLEPQPYPYFVHFQVVRMDGETPRPLVSHDRQEDKGERTVVQGGTHEIDWLNEFSQPVTVAHHVPAGYTRLLYPPGEGPGCVIGLREATNELADGGGESCVLAA